MENKPDKILTGKNISRYLKVAGTEAEIITGNPSSQTKVESNKTSKPTPQEKNKKEPSYYEKINQIARLLENQKISQIVFHGGKRESKEGEDDEWKISTDLDAESASILFNLFNKKPLEKMYAEGAHTAIVPKGGSDEDLEIKKEGLIVYIDNGDKWIKVEKDGKKTKVYFDHHGKGRGPNTSATKMVYDLLKKQNPKIEEENPWLFKYVKGVNDFDNLNYLNREYFNKEHFEQVWPYTLNHIASQMKASDLMNLFNSGIITDFSKSIKGLLNEEIELEKLNQDYSTEIRKIKFGDITLKNGKTINEQIAIETSKNIGENNVKKTTTGIENADKFETDLLGKVVFNDNKRIDNKNGNGYHKNIIPNHLAFIGTKALGYDTYIAWNEKDKNFFINSNEEGLGEIIKKLNEADPDCALDVRGVMVFGTIKNLTKEQFKKILGLNEKIGNEKVKTNKNLTENEIKIQKNNEEIAELDKKINELNKEIENMDEEIAKLQAMILALPDDEPEPTPQPQAINEPKVEKPEEISLNEGKEGKITSKDFKELVRLSKFFLENPKEPTTVGSVVNKYPELFEEITKIEKRRKEELEILKNYRKTGILKGEVAENFNKKFKVNILDKKGDVNLFDEMDRIINAKYDEELAELEKTQVEKVEVDESERKKTERLAKSAAQSIAEGIIAMNSKENTKSVENSKIIRLEELEKEIQENINKLLEKPETEEELKPENSETKRDGKENYEGWKTSYHYDLEKPEKEGAIGLKIAKKTSEKTPLSLYEIKEKGDEMVLFLIETDFTRKMFIDYARKQLEPLFELPNNKEPKLEVRLIKTVRPAKFKKEGEFWVLVEKGEVEYIK